MRLESLLIVLYGLGLSYGAYTEAQKMAYEKALKPAVYTALLSDMYRAEKDRMFPHFVDFRVTKVSTAVPYNKNIGLIQTAMPGHPVFIPYMFEATEGGGKKLECSLTVAEFKNGKDFYYIVPYRNDLLCEASAR